MIILPVILTKRILVFAVALFSVALTPFSTGGRQKAEIAFCIDLSASTNGLLNDIRDNLWHFINGARMNMPETDLRIGIVGFGRPSFKKENYYTTVLCDITENYDLISYSLFQLKANIEKGDQCVGNALHKTLTNLNWNQDTRTKKMIYFFGNGSVKMGGYDYRRACEIAVKKNISVNAVYCVQNAINQKDLPGWNAIASLTGGDFYTYYITKRTPLQRSSGNSKWLADLNEKLQDTYIYFTKDGRQRYDMMCAADANSQKMNEQFFYSRCIYKFSSHYGEQCAQWDLVSLLKTNPPDFSKLDKKYLPENFQLASVKALKEVAMIKKERRDFLYTQMRSAFVNLPQDTALVNPIDSVFLSGISRQ